jgi:hypothetical protein
VVDDAETRIGIVWLGAAGGRRDRTDDTASATPVVVDSPGTIGARPEVPSIPPAASATAGAIRTHVRQRRCRRSPTRLRRPRPRSAPTLLRLGTAGETTPADPTEGTKPGPAVPPTETVAKPPPRVTKKTVQPADPAQADSASDRAECARIFQRLSLGESSPELLARLKTLKCK